MQRLAAVRQREPAEQAQSMENFHGFVEAMRAKKLPVTYIVYTDEGHGFARPNSRLDFYGRVDEFLAKYLGGRSEPWNEVNGANVEVR